MWSSLKDKIKSIINDPMGYVRTGRMYDGYPLSHYAIELVVFTPIIIVCIVLLCTVVNARPIAGVLLGVSVIYLLRLWRLLPSERQRRALEVNLLLLEETRRRMILAGPAPRPLGPSRFLPSREAVQRPLSVTAIEVEMAELPPTMAWYTPMPPSPNCYIPAAVESSQQFLQHVSLRESQRCPPPDTVRNHEPFDTTSFPASHSPFSSVQSTNVHTAPDTCASEPAGTEVLILSEHSQHDHLRMG